VSGCQQLPACVHGVGVRVVCVWGAQGCGERECGRVAIGCFSQARHWVCGRVVGTVWLARWPQAACMVPLWLARCVARLHMQQRSSCGCGVRLGAAASAVLLPPSAPLLLVLRSVLRPAQGQWWVQHPGPRCGRSAGAPRRPLINRGQCGLRVMPAEVRAPQQAVLGRAPARAPPPLHPVRQCSLANVCVCWCEESSLFGCSAQRCGRCCMLTHCALVIGAQLQQRCGGRVVCVVLSQALGGPGSLRRACA
jgi:hypothetical protein